MEKNYTIKDVSELLNIPKSTIRYWDEQGLISTTRNEENGYRTFDLEDLFKKFIQIKSFWLKYKSKTLFFLFEIS